MSYSLLCTLYCFVDSVVTWLKRCPWVIFVWVNQRTVVDHCRRRWEKDQVALLLDKLRYLDYVMYEFESLLLLEANSSSPAQRYFPNPLNAAHCFLVHRAPATCPIKVEK